jgi:hypothetical protein
LPDAASLKILWQRCAFNARSWRLKSWDLVGDELVIAEWDRATRSMWDGLRHLPLARWRYTQPYRLEKRRP